jgi:hypothetical protein
MSWHHGTSVGMYRQRIVQRPCVHADIIIFCYTYIYIYIYIIHGHNDIWIYIYIRCLGIIVLPLGCIASASLQRSCIHKDINIFGYIQMHIYLYIYIYIYILKFQIWIGTISWHRGTSFGMYHQHIFRKSAYILI